MIARISDRLILKLTPAARTTFSSIIVLPRSFAPNRKANCAIFEPCVTHEAWILGKLSRKRRDIASVIR